MTNPSLQQLLDALSVSFLCFRSCLISLSLPTFKISQVKPGGSGASQPSWEHQGAWRMLRAAAAMVGKGSRSSCCHLDTGNCCCPGTLRWCREQCEHRRGCLHPGHGHHGFSGLAPHGAGHQQTPVPCLGLEPPPQSCCLTQQ